MMNCFKISSGVLFFNYLCYNFGRLCAVPIIENERQPIDILLEGLAIHHDEGLCNCSFLNTINHDELLKCVSNIKN